MVLKRHHTVRQNFENVVGFNFMLCFYCSRGVHCRCLYIGTMEGKLELFSQGMQSSWFMSGMGVPGSKVV